MDKLPLLIAENSVLSGKITVFTVKIIFFVKWLYGKTSLSGCQIRIFHVKIDLSTRK